MNKLSLSLLASAAVLTVFAAKQAFALDAAQDSAAAEQSSAIRVADTSEASLQKAQAFVDSLAKKGIAFWENSEITPDERAAQWRTLLQTSFDMSTIGKFVLGQYWKQATPAQQKEYQSLFQDMIVRVYSQRFGEYKGQQLEVTKARPEGKYDVLVNSFVVPQSGEKISVDWRVREKGGTYKVVDIIVEGVSMALTHRSDFASVIQRGGGDINVLIDHLRSK